MSEYTPKKTKRTTTKKKAAPEKKAAPVWERIDVGNDMWRMKKGDVNIGPFYTEESCDRACKRADGTIKF